MRAIHALLIGVLVLAVAASDIPSARAQAVDPGAGVILGEGPAGPQPQLTCTLTISPNVVTNGQTFSMSINYSPSIGPGSWTEKFIFKWPSTLATFGEKTVRMKIFKNFPNAVSGSFETEVAPTATAIKGTFPVKVKVRGFGGCSATANLTVN